MCIQPALDPFIQLSCHHRSETLYSMFKHYINILVMLHMSEQVLVSLSIL